MKTLQRFPKEGLTFRTFLLQGTSCAWHTYELLALSTSYDAFPAQRNAVDALHLSHLIGKVHRTFAGGWCGCDLVMQPSLTTIPADHLPCCVLHFQPAHHDAGDALLCLTSNDRDNLGFLNHCTRLTLFILAYRFIAIKPCARSF